MRKSKQTSKRKMIELKYNKYISEALWEIFQEHAHLPKNGTSQLYLLNQCWMKTEERSLPSISQVLDVKQQG